MNIIFLVIDGGLNSNFWNDVHQKEISDETLIDIEKIKLLSSLVSEYAAKVILHFGWKYWFDSNGIPLRVESERLKAMLLECRIKIEGITPDLASHEIKRTKQYSLVKAEEILQWLSEHLACKWIVIEDLDLHNEEIRKHQIMTDANVGLTEYDIEEARKLFAELEIDRRVSVNETRKDIEDL